MFDPVGLLERAPRSVRRLAARVIAGKGILGKMADVLRFRYSASEVPKGPPVSEARVRFFIGPANSAGQGFQWARAVEREIGDASAVAMRGLENAPSIAMTDLNVPVAVYQRSPKWHHALEEFLSRQSNVVWESGLPLLGRRYDSDPLREIRVLQSRGVRAALMFHGSDIRPPSLHAAESPWSPFGANIGTVRALEVDVERNQALAQEAEVPVFVSTPDLLRWCPNSTWCPVVIDPAAWRLAKRNREPNSRPVVLHIPSTPWLKGTKLIEPILQSLSSEGVIEYRQVSEVFHSEIPSLYGEADIILDQFALGSYGVAACEALASKKLVVSHIDESTRATVKEITGFDLPIVEANLETLESVLRRIAADPSRFEAFREQGSEFVAVVHSGSFSAKALAPFLNETI